MSPVNAVGQKLPIDNAVVRRNFLSVNAQATSKDRLFIVRARVVTERYEKGFAVAFEGEGEADGNSVEKTSIRPRPRQRWKR